VIVNQLVWELTSEEDLQIINDDDHAFVGRTYANDVGVDARSISCLAILDREDTDREHIKGAERLSHDASRPSARSSSQSNVISFSFGRQQIKRTHQQRH